MKYLFLFLLLLSPVFGFAKSKAKLGTDFQFDPHSVKGNYQYSDQAEANVENEKTLNTILQPRKQFKDRIKLETSLKQEPNRKTGER